MLFLKQPRIVAFIRAGLETRIFPQNDPVSLQSHGQKCREKSSKEWKWKRSSWLNYRDPSKGAASPRRCPRELPAALRPAVGGVRWAGSLRIQPCPGGPHETPAKTPVLPRWLSGGPSGPQWSTGFNHCRDREACCQVKLTRRTAGETAFLSSLWLHGVLQQENRFEVRSWYRKGMFKSRQFKNRTLSRAWTCWAIVHPAQGEQQRKSSSQLLPWWTGYDVGGAAGRHCPALPNTSALLSPQNQLATRTSLAKHSWLVSKLSQCFTCLNATQQPDPILSIHSV